MASKSLRHCSQLGSKGKGLMTEIGMGAGSCASERTLSSSRLSMRVCLVFRLHATAPHERPAPGTCADESRVRVS